MTPVRVALALAAMASLAAAADYPQEARKLSLKERHGRQSLSWSARVPPPVLPAASPVAIGATLELRTQAGETASFDLPASGWTADDSGQTFKFKDPASAMRAVTLRNQRALKARGGQTGLTLDEATQGTVTIALVIGDDVYCSTCTAAHRDEPGRYVARRCPPPAGCSLTTTTTTSSSTTTSTFVSGICGNGVVDQPSEQCDAPDPGVCDDVVLPFAVDCGAPASSTPCECCGTTNCFFGVSSGNLPCCDSAQCQDVTGAGMERSGICIPPSCTQSSDCNGEGYECVGDTCCAQPGKFCGVVDCCPGSGATCTAVFPTTPICCRPAGGSCDDPAQCCSFSCTGTLCD
jgi:hypothetical protein